MSSIENGSSAMSAHACVFKKCSTNPHCLTCFHMLVCRAQSKQQMRMKLTPYAANCDRRWNK